jgi:hypothetical protein
VLAEAGGRLRSARGLSAQAPEELMDGVAAGCPVVGLEITAYHAPEGRAQRERLTGLLAGAAWRRLGRPRT